MTISSISRLNLHWDSLIQALSKNAKDPDKALTVLRDCLKVKGILPSSYTFSSLIRSFSSQGKLDRAIEVLELMTDEKINYPLDNFVCSSVISGFVRIGKPELALGFYENAANSAALKSNIATYTALLSAYCRLGRNAEVNELVSRIEKDQLAFDVVFYSCWMNESLRDGDFKKAIEKYREMEKRNIKSDTIQHTTLVHGFAKEGHVEKTVGFLNKMKKEGLKPDLVTYTAIMRGFCQKGKTEEALAVFKLVEDLGIILDEFAYATLIDGLCVRGDFDLVFHLLDDMEKKDIRASVVTYNTVINGLCRAGRTSEAEEISKSILGDVVTYSTLLHAYIEEENAMGVLETKQRLEEAGIHFDVVMCNILIKALFMVGAFADALATYDGMPEHELAADSVTYCTLIDGYCKVGRISEAIEIFDEFRKTSIPSVACYNCLIYGLCKKGMVDMAIEVFIELDDRGLHSDAGMHTVLLKATVEEKGAAGVLDLIQRCDILRPELFDILCNKSISFLCKKGFPEAACDVYVVMKRKGSVVTRKSYYSILEVLIHNGNKWQVQPILSTFLRTCGVVEPKVSTILVQYLCMKDANYALRFFEKIRECGWTTATIPVTVFDNLTKNGRVLDAYKLIRGTEDNLPRMDVVDYSIIVDRLCKGGHIRKALDLCEFARKKGITLSIVTYNSVINGLCRLGCLVEAFRLFDSLKKINVAPSEITYAILIDILTKEGHLVDARKLFERMVLLGLKPSTRVYNLLINGYCKMGQMLEGLKLLLDLEVKCLKPDEFTVSAVINGFCRNGDMEAALESYFDFKRKGHLPDFLGFMYLLSGLCSKGRLEESRSILREMLQTQSVINLLNKVETDVQTESMEQFLFFLCEQGRIQETITVLNEVGSMFFPVERWRTGASRGPEKLKEIYDSKAFGIAASKSLLSSYDTDMNIKSSDAESTVKNYAEEYNRSQLCDFDSYYDQLASLCAKGELLEANKLAKMLTC
ncbi:hypothetical protein RJ639_029969 [Escallonia herrerae]|uniref:Pentatricopeptide repeat-containing protein n=1 Tax=Escallonia herrerae TaxID=1293975 RepID=A0AA88X728_9ASTE|nr:hypothetical protein RJ639_029969 [Escallonia herrerae]